MSEYLNALGERAKKASIILGTLSEEEKNKAIFQIAEDLKIFANEIITSNKFDVDNLIAGGKGLNMIDRLTLNEKRIEEMAEGAKQVTQLKDPVGEVVESFTRPNGLVISKVRVPLGVVGIIYESRPNVTVDAAMLCLKAGNAVILRGGSEAINSNKVLVNVIAKALEKSGLPKDSVQLIEQTDREIATQFMRLNKYVDVLIPRGGAGLIKAILENATIPVIETGTGNCHVYVDNEADLNIANDIVINAKTQRPSVCNAMETLLVDAEIAEEYLPVIAGKLMEKNVEIRGCNRTSEILGSSGIVLKNADETDWETEYNDLILAVKVISGVEEAIEHINKYGTRHSECIVSENKEKINIFQKKVDAACVYANASTRFTDGFEFGYGAEIGISNQKLHARGPMGLKELTTIKYIISGTGQIRG